MIKKYLNTDALYVLIILLISLLSITWFRGDNLINQGDFGLPLDRLSYFKHTIYTWDDSISTGYSAPRQLIALLPYSIFAAISEIIRISLVNYEKIIFLFLFGLSGISMYFLCSILSLPRFGRLFASIFYMMNPFSLQIIWHIGYGLVQINYAIIPLLLGLFIRGIKNDFNLNYIIIFGLVWTFFSSAYINPVYAVVHWFILFSYAFYSIIVDKKFTHVLKFTSALLLIWILLNSFILIPNIQDILGSISQASHSSSSGFISDVETLRLNSVNIIDGYRLSGVWALNGEYYGEPYYYWGESYFKPSFILISFLIPILAIYPLLKRKLPSDLIFMSILALTGVFLITGVNSPFSAVAEKFYSNFSIFAAAFRNIFGKFGVIPTLAFSPLIGYSVYMISEKIKKYSLNLSIITSFLIVFLLLFVLAYPFWNGDVINSGGEYVSSERIKIPHYYDDSKLWLNQEDSYYRVMSFPMSKNYNIAYSWDEGTIRNSYSGSDFMRWYSNKPIINANINPVINLIGESLGNKNFIGLPTKTMALLNVKYILLHGDTNWKAISGHSWFFTNNQVDLEKRLEDFEQINVFGKLYFYRLTEELLPHVYTTSNQLSVMDIGELSNVIESESFVLGQQNILVLSQNINKTMPTINSVNRPHISFQRVNPTKYKIKIENGHDPFYLTFSESFHIGWKAYIDDYIRDCKSIATYDSLNVIECQPESDFFEIKDLTRIFGESIPEENHLVVNGYANGWYINSEELGVGDNFTITLYFKPQSYFYIGLIISGMTFLWCVGYLVWNLRKSIHKVGFL